MISGCNGAGKSTLVASLMPKILGVDMLINPDEIARGLDPYHPERVSLRAGALALEKMDEYIAKRHSFAFETTGSGIVQLKKIKTAITQGYTFHIIYLWIENPEVAIERVAYRASQGGHSVPPDDIRRRYYRGLNNVMSLYLPHSDSAVFYTNTFELGTSKPKKKGNLQLIALFDKIRGYTIIVPDMWAKLQSQKGKT